ncbi:holo-ACP synthase [Pokkaliibacter plantistimulans]|nr:holo-ACP synthase [Pokkaliibacter plantistimulans]
MICGIGTDMVAIGRIAEVMERTRERFARKILGEQEWHIYQQVSQPHAWLAKRWAAKEACAKALGTGVAQGLSLTHIQVLNNAQGAPLLQLSGRALELAEACGASRWHVSLSDEKDYALAFVVLSRD